MGFSYSIGDEICYYIRTWGKKTYYLIFQSCARIGRILVLTRMLRRIKPLAVSVGVKNVVTN